MSRLIVAFFLLLAGCTAPPLEELNAAHPASPEAKEAPTPSLTDTLAIGEEEEPPSAEEPPHHVH